MTRKTTFSVQAVSASHQAEGFTTAAQAIEAAKVAAKKYQTLVSVVRDSDNREIWATGAVS